MVAQLVSHKPRLRGVLHQWAFLASLPLGLALVAVAGSPRARIAVALYAVSVAALFGTSALYHRVEWRSLKARAWMRRLDHSMIFVLIAGTYTPFALLVLGGAFALAILVAVWAGALIGVLLSLVWTNAPAWLRAANCVALGWVAVVALPQLATGLGVRGVTLVALGGLLYTLGAIVYAAKRPDPRPLVFGYHEVFHALVVIAAALQYSVIALWVAPS